MINAIRSHSVAELNGGAGKWLNRHHLCHLSASSIYFIGIPDWERRTFFFVVFCCKNFCDFFQNFVHQPVAVVPLHWQGQPIMTRSCCSASRGNAYLQLFVVVLSRINSVNFLPPLKSLRRDKILKVQLLMLPDICMQIPCYSFHPDDHNSCTLVWPLKVS